MSWPGELLKGAIIKEHGAVQLYEGLAAQSENDAAKALLLALADDERRHEDLLAEISPDGFIAQQPPQVDDLRISDFLEERELTPNATFQEVLIFAAKKEHDSWKFYGALAEIAQHPEAKALQERLSAEEKAHKNRLEKLYDDIIYRED